MAEFYARLAEEAPVERVVIGELVCSKRLPFYQDVLPEAIERLQKRGQARRRNLARPADPFTRARRGKGAVPDWHRGRAQ